MGLFCTSMHLVVGIVRIAVARLYLTLYRRVGWKWLGRSVIRHCCRAALAGSGIDDAALEVIDEMGPDGMPLLEREADQQGEMSFAAVFLKIMRSRA
jgi:hypothetical protein